MSIVKQGGIAIRRSIARPPNKISFIFASSSRVLFQKVTFSSSALFRRMHLNIFVTGVSSFHVLVQIFTGLSVDRAAVTERVHMSRLVAKHLAYIQP